MPKGGPLDNPANRELQAWAAAHLTPTPERQAAFVGTTFALGAGASLPAGLQVRLLNKAVHLYAAAVAMGDAYPALGPDYKFGVRYGGTGEVTTMGEAVPFTRRYGVASKYTPWPDFGFGLTAVPNTSSRWVYENNKSRPGGHTVQTERVAGPPQTRKSMRGASAQKKRSKKPKFVRYRTGGCPPGYSYDPKRKMCIHNSYR